MCRVILSHDVDRVYKTYQYFTYMIKSIKNLDFHTGIYHLKTLFQEKNPYWNFDKIIEIENKYDVKSLFFFLNESIGFNLFDSSNWKLSLGRYSIYNREIIDIIKYLDENGWEIGVHGSYNSYMDKDLLFKEKKDLECIVNHKINGVRQHYLNLNENTWQIQNDCGFKYDLTFGYKNKVGFREDKIKPFHPLNNNFTAYPLGIMDIYFMQDENRWEKFYNILNQVEKKKAILVINWHQRVFNDDEFPKFIEAYEKIIIECKNRNFNFDVEL